MRPYDIEQQLIAHVITFGNDAARICLPQLTQEKFIFGFRGEFSVEHSSIWLAIRRAYLINNLSPLLSVLRGYCELHEIEYLEQLPKPTNLDPVFVEQLTNLVDRQGLVYNISKYGHALGSNIESTEHFMQTLDSIQDVEQWATHQLDALRTYQSAQSSGYEHISVVNDRVRQRWEDIRSGKVSPLVDSGWPVLRANYLCPAGEMVIVHGLPASGKSTFVFQVQLGTAINLYLHNKPGCVAINSLEMTPENLTERLAGILAGVDISKLKKGCMSTEDYTNLVKWSHFVDVLPIFIDGTNFLTTTAMQYRATGLHVSPNGPVVQLSSDYSELFADEDTNGSKEQKVSKVFREQFALSRMIGASVLAISQSTVDTSVSGKTYIAGPDGIRYSKGGLHAADWVLELWNPVQIEKAPGRRIILGDDSTLNKTHPFLLVQKGRNAEFGQSIPLGWIPEYTTFFDMSFAGDPRHKPNSPVLYENLDKAYKKYEEGVTGW